MNSGVEQLAGSPARWRLLLSCIVLMSIFSITLAWRNESGLWLIGASTICLATLCSACWLARQYRLLDQLTEALEHHQTDDHHFPVDTFQGGDDIGAQALVTLGV